jgi:phosphate-selective porin OprO/OprP
MTHAPGLCAPPLRRGLRRAGVAALLLGVVLPAALTGQEDGDPVVGHGSDGFFIETADGAWRTALQFRMQFRLSSPSDDYSDDGGTSMAVNRARLKVGGHGYRPWLGYYFEYDVASSTLLNWELTLEPDPRIGLRVGQWKAQYSRERIVSSGRQQLVDRSLVNRYFTIDRQQGVSLFGHLGAGTSADVQYWASVFTGLGRGGSTNDDDRLMYMGRLQWNPFGRSVRFAGSDLARSPEPTLSVALAGVTNRSPCTRFSTSGCGSLDRFPDQDPERYRTQQALFETAFTWRGFSWAQEAHWKRVRDRTEATETDLTGHYVQIGYFPGEVWDGFPENLELATRWATFRLDVDRPDNRQHEFSVGANWFFSGHSNKLTAEVAWLSLQENVLDPLDEGPQLLLQWDIQF